MPFLAWDCLTIKLPHRDVDLVFKNETDQNQFTKFLIFNLNTIDGSKNTAIPILNALEEQAIKEYCKSKNLRREKFKPDSASSFITKIREDNKLKLTRKAYVKYLIIKLRMKISFIA